MAKKKRKLTAWQKHVKAYMADHPGLSFKEALPKAKLTYGKSSRSQKVTKGKNPKRRRKTRMAKRRRRRRSSSMTIPLAPTLGLASGMYEGVNAMFKGNMEGGLNTLMRNYTGFDFKKGDFQAPRLSKGLLPLVVGLLVHKYVGGAPLNLNRVLGRAKVPIVRI